MSLYYHVPGKQGLLDGLTEAVLDEVNAAVAARFRPDDSWPTAPRHRCLAAREVMVRHRWAPALLGSRSSIPKGLHPYYEEILATMFRGGLSYQELFSPDSDGGTLDGEAAEAEFAAMAAVLPHLTATVASEVHDHEEDPLGVSRFAGHQAGCRRCW